MPEGVAKAKELDRVNGNTMWMDALKLEMHNIGIAFEVLEDGERAPPGWNKVTGHIILDPSLTGYCMEEKVQEGILEITCGPACIF